MNLALLAASALVVAALAIRAGLPALRRRAAVELDIAAGARAAGVKPPTLPAPGRGSEVARGNRRLDRHLLVASALVYLFTRLADLERFPIYFFTDEAAQAVLAFDLLQGAFRVDGELLPTYFVNSEKHSLGASVYLQVPTVWSFGKSVWATRATAVLATLPGALALAAIMGRIFGARHPWLPVALLGIAPVWLIHSRTAFETVLATSLLAICLLLYLTYLHRAPAALYPALAVAAIAFYTYSPARIIVVGVLVGLAILDWPYHLRQWRVVLGAWWLLPLLALPHLRFVAGHPGAERFHLELIDSILVRDIGLAQKAFLVSNGHLQALNPFYWFLPNDIDLVRHVMPGAGHLPLALLPFFAIGVWRSAARIGTPAHRALLVALVVAPIGGSVGGLLVTRVLPAVVPLVLLSALGLAWALERLESARVDGRRIAIAAFALLTAAGVALTREGIERGPTWYDDYGLYGMQFGAPLVMERVAELRKAEPERPIIVSPWWLNGPEMIGRFFLQNPADVIWDGPAWHVDRRDPHAPETIFVMPANEYEWIVDSGAVEAVDVIETIPYPDGSPGFYFATIRYE